MNRLNYFLCPLLKLCENGIHRAMSGAAQVQFLLNGKTVSVPNHYSILRAAKREGIVVPTFCYHERLAVAGNCRMCLVEIVGVPKPQIACATPVAKGMKVRTDSRKALVAQEGALEFLLVNHPLDCPVCDQGGECDLQDLTMRFGPDRSRFTDIHFSGKRAVEDKNLGPLIRTEMTRCIHCTRCIRFASEVCGLDELGTTGRGTDMQVGTYVDKMFLSELSGNIVDLCPVGALTATPYTFRARPWETRIKPSIDVTDATGTNIVVHYRGDRVMRVLPRENDQINLEWLSDKGRWSIDSLELQRLVSPMYRNGGGLLATDWRRALCAAKDFITTASPENVYAVAGPHCNVETLVAAKDFLNALGSENTFMEKEFDFASCGTDFRAGYLMNVRMKDIIHADKILLVGTNPRFEAPVLNAWIRRAYIENDADIFTVGSECQLNYFSTHLGESSELLERLISADFACGKRPLILVGISQLTGGRGATLMKMLYKIAASFTSVPEGWEVVNVVGREASWAGALECGWKPGANQAMRCTPPKVLLLLGADRALGEAVPEDCRIVYVGFQGDRGAEAANVILPGSAFTEAGGLYLNMEGRAQRASAAVTPPGLARPDWKILRALAEICEVHLPYSDEEGMRYRMCQISPNLVTLDCWQPRLAAELVHASAEAQAQCSPPAGSWPLCVELRALPDYYCTDVFTRNSPAMARTTCAAQAAAASPYAGV